MRGKHVNRGNVLSPDVLRKIDEHINSFPKYSTHYTKMPITYLDATLTVRKMHDMFLEKHEDLKNIVKYEYFLKYFRDNFGYRFGRPQVDVCSTCEELQTKIKSKTLNDNAKRTAAAEFVVHKRRAKKFFSKLQEVKELSKAKPEVMGIVFDFMQNLPLPHLPVQEMFYLRKLWYYVFKIFDLKNDTAVFYNYPEGIANKGPDEVASFILNYVENFIPNTVTELHVFSDACGGQNRNHTLCRVLTALTMNNRFKIIHQYFPIRGHSFMPCDRTFAVIKRAVRRHDRIYSPDQYKDIIESAKKEVPTYKVIEVKNEDILDCKNWWPEFFTKLPKSLESKTPFSISKCRHFTVDSERKGYLKTSEFIDAVVHMTFKLNKPNIVDVPLPTNRVYNGKVPIKEQKLQDLGKLIKYIPHDFLTFYEERRTWPTGAVDDDANEHE
ncbi:uncharacterized protein LOC124370001 [Homalodisca vitripennis]|uniref:uncharacterized protein LOC124370001 n=1 Tax=Homalodisca vitripennis TaxID=197043 RepID=UPI001EEC843A|nr:uncharacterized protein LOC124370001 [Homalodisca vitripennis]